MRMLNPGRVAMEVSSREETDLLRSLETIELRFDDPIRVIERCFELFQGDLECKLEIYRFNTTADWVCLIGTDIPYVPYMELRHFPLSAVVARLLTAFANEAIDVYDRCLLSPNTIPADILKQEGALQYSRKLYESGEDIAYHFTFKSSEWIGLSRGFYKQHFYCGPRSDASNKHRHNSCDDLFPALFEFLRSSFIVGDVATIPSKARKTRS